jgi:hypothetical protein
MFRLSEVCQITDKLKKKRGGVKTLQLSSFPTTFRRALFLVSDVVDTELHGRLGSRTRVHFSQPLFTVNR